MVWKKYEGKYKGSGFFGIGGGLVEEIPREGVGEGVLDESFPHPLIFDVGDELIRVVLFLVLPFFELVQVN